jgi:hypothetical protein
MRCVLIHQHQPILIFHQDIESVQNADDLELLRRLRDIDRLIVPGAGLSDPGRVRQPRRFPAA